MSPLIKQLIEKQRDCERMLVEFYSSLAPELTVTLADLLEGKGLERLQITHWFRPEQFRKRLTSFCHFLDRVPDRPFIFFQPWDPAADDRDHQKRCERDPHMYSSKYATCGPRAWYLHTRCVWWPKLLGNPEQRNCTIPPGFGYTDWLRKWPIRPLGFHVPDYTKLLGVSPAVATDYFARMIVHDLGHASLPKICGEMEPLHDITMVYAMGVRGGEVAYRNEWEQTVHGECTGYLFLFTDGVETLRRIGPRHTPAQEALRQDLISRYSEKFPPDTLFKIWKIPSNLSENRLVRRVQKEINLMRASKFTRYAA